MSKGLSGFIASCKYFDRVFIVLFATSSGVSIVYFSTVIVAPAGIVSASFSFAFFITAKIIKKLLKAIWFEKKEHNKIVKIARNKLNSSETIISQTLKDSEIVHEEYTTTINEEEKYRGLKERILQWWGVREVMLSKINWLKKVKRLESIRLLSKILKTPGAYFLTHVKMININAETYAKNGVGTLFDIMEGFG